MGYLREFLTQINNRDFHKFLVLWEEYCTTDVVDVEELSQLLKSIKQSDLARHFGQIVETAIPLWKMIQDKQDAYEILRLLSDLQTTNQPLLVDLIFNFLKETHGQDPKFNERIRLAGLRDKENFQGAISKYDLLAHMVKANIVFHTGGWGTGEIIDISFVREHLNIEFENVAGRKDISFINAFKTLIPLSQTHFLARRFANPDLLEKEGREDPLKLIQLLLHDLGPKTAAEIKDELCELVIPEEDWTKWWQGARAKIKKSALIEWPEKIKEPFYLRKKELSPQERFKEIVQHKATINEALLAIYNFTRDTPNALKSEETKQALQGRLHQMLQDEEVTKAQQIQIDLLLEQLFGDKASEKRMISMIENENHLEEIIQAIEIIAFKKRVLVAIKDCRSEWIALFCELLFSLSQGQLRDYLLRELNSQPEGRQLLEKKIKELLCSPIQNPDVFVWYFQKVIGEDDSILFQDKEGRHQFFENFFILYSALEGKNESRDLLKKMYNLLSAKRYALVRELLKETTLEFAKELLLLISKCQTLSDHDVKILRSLTEVVHPSLTLPKQKKEGHGSQIADEEIWTTEEGYLRIQERIRQIGTVEVIENAREIEAARALGDLRENSEFKFAQERRARLQSELTTLSSQFSRARLITPNDIHPNEIGVGNTVRIVNIQGKETVYTILGPWDANPDKNILSFNSKFAQAMMGKKAGQNFTFRDDKYNILTVGSYIVD